MIALALPSASSDSFITQATTPSTRWVNSPMNAVRAVGLYAQVAGHQLAESGVCYRNVGLVGP
jgi:hypothetical protein